MKKLIGVVALAFAIFSGMAITASSARADAGDWWYAWMCRMGLISGPVCTQILNPPGGEHPIDQPSGAL